MYLNAIERTGGDFAGEDSYLQDIPAIKGLSLLELRQPVTFLVGENGSGKSTLLEAVALALGFNPEGGSRNFSFSTRDTHSGLHAASPCTGAPTGPRTVFSKGGELLQHRHRGGGAVQAEPRPAGRILQKLWRQVPAPPVPRGEFSQPGAQPVPGRGHLPAGRAGGRPLPARQLTLLAELHRLVSAGSQLVIATHSPI